MKRLKTLDDILRESMNLYIKDKTVVAFIEAVKHAYFEGYREGCIIMAGR
jgi:hypothetical protein